MECTYSKDWRILSVSQSKLLFPTPNANYCAAWINSMSGWFDRRQQRLRELQQGADADLVRENHKRWKLAWRLSGLGFLLCTAQTKVKLPTVWHNIVFWSSATTFLVGVVLLRWAYHI